ncbi:uncharacterized protein [Palaemon carinicauda]
MITLFLLLSIGMSFAHTTESYDADMGWELVGDLIDETYNDTAQPLDDSHEGLLDAEDPPVFSDEMCSEMLKYYDEQKMEKMGKTEGALNDETLDQPSGFLGSGLYGNRPYGFPYGNRYRPYYNGPYGSYGRCLRTGRYGGYSLCYGRRRVQYGPYTYCCRVRYLRPFVLRRGRYVRCRCY